MQTIRDIAAEQGKEEYAIWILPYHLPTPLLRKLCCSIGQRQVS